MANQTTIPTPATPDICTYEMLLDGELLPAQYHVLSITVEREVNRVPHAKIILQDGQVAKATFPLSNTELLIPGKVIEVQLGYRANNDTVFKGIIVKHSIKMRENGSQLVIVCKDVAVKMTTDIKSNCFVDQKDSDIIEALIASYDGLSASVAATKPALTEVVQYQTSDWDFMLCRAEANGQVVLVEDGTVTLSAPDTSSEAVVELQYGATLLELDAEIDVRTQSNGINAATWDAVEQVPLMAEAKEPNVKSGGNLSPSDLAEVISSDPSQITHGGQLQQDELQAWADARLLRERLAKVRGRAKCQGLASVLPGKMIKVSGIGDRFEGDLYVSGIRHTLANGAWGTDVQFGLQATTFSEMQAGKQPTASGLIPAINGLQIGVVTALVDDPAGEERIKVKLPMVHDGGEGVWARLSTSDGGKKRGMYFRPELEDEVIVGFLNDDPRNPVILGSMHGSKHPSPEQNTEDNFLKGYVSREQLKMTFDDENKAISFETEAGNKVLLSESEEAVMIEDQHGNKITMDSSGIQIESSKDLILKAENDVMVEGANIEHKAQTGLKLEGAASADFKGANVSVEGSASTTIKGGIVQIN